MSSIDQRVVEMTFDNKQFERGIKSTLRSLDALKDGLVFDDATEGLNNFKHSGQDIGQNFNLSGMIEGVELIASRFNALGAVGFTVIQNLTKYALDFAGKIGATLLDPLIGGGKKRALNIEQAKFQFRGLGMDVEDTMASALEAVTGTAYGLDEAARAAGQFGASGMRAGEDMTTALRAISGVAAMTNSSYTDTADIFTKVAGNGRVMGDDLLRMSSRGLNAAATLAESMGVTEAAVREMVTEGEVSFEIFYEAMDEAFGENAQKANETYTGSLANLRAAFSRLGASFFTPYLEHMRRLFVGITPTVDAFAKALKPAVDLMLFFTGRASRALTTFAKDLDFTGLAINIKPVTRIVKDLYFSLTQIASIIGSAFQEIFPPATTLEIFNIL
ncbi:MAG: tape measure protein [Actinobacteria bacterium]|nr:tape measure protein [Actinomycetota bacterium]